MPLADIISQLYLRVPFIWRRWRDTRDEGKFRPIVLTAVVSSQSWRYFVSLARRTGQGAVTFGQSIDSTRGCAVVLEMKGMTGKEQKVVGQQRRDCGRSDLGLLPPGHLSLDGVSG